ncbi:hypothetical protein F4808DRAFT_404900 [Astrocystis sublimbata]|nr:hypothetical protein F4808DRAFT_404900 [Astrocystis sublimbata]
MPLPEVLMTKVDEYVDSLAPQIQPRITNELEDFQQKTIDVLETQVIDAFRSLFNRDEGAPPGASRGLDDAIPNAYGDLSLPFANELSSLTRSFGKIADETGDDLRDIFNLTEGGAGSGGTRDIGGGDRPDSSQRMRGFLSAAINAVQDHLDDGNGGSGGQKLELGGLLGVLSSSVKDVARNPEDTARRISPEIKERIGAKLRENHASVAEQFTRIALDHIKRWLRGNTSTRDIGDGAKGEIEDHVKDIVKGIGNLFGSKKDHGERSIGDGTRDGGDGEGGSSGGGFSKVISEKLSTGIANVHREVRLEFRKVLGGIEKNLFEMLPDELQGSLEKILGGNPFDSQLERDAGSSHADRGFGDDIKAKLVNKIRGLVQKVQQMLRQSILGVVNGGHRKFERASWVFVQNMVEEKVQRYLPKVRITVPDDIGNEGVDMGAPKPGAQFGDHFAPPPQSEHQQDQRPDHQQNQHQPPHQEYPPPPHQEYRPDQYQPPHQEYPPPPQQDYRPDYQSHHQEYRPDQYQRPHQEYPPPPTQEYRPSDQYHQPQQGHDYQNNQWQDQNPRY